MSFRLRGSRVALALALVACGEPAPPSTTAPTSPVPASSVVPTSVAPPVSAAPTALRVGRALVLNGPEAIMPPFRNAVVLVDRGAAPAPAPREGAPSPETLGA